MGVRIVSGTVPNMSDKEQAKPTIEEQLKQAQDTLNETNIKLENTEKLAKALQNELQWIKGEYVLTLSSLFDALFDITSQVKDADIRKLYEKRRAEMMQAQARQPHKSTS